MRARKGCCKLQLWRGTVLLAIYALPQRVVCTNAAVRCQKQLKWSLLVISGSDRPAFELAFFPARVLQPLAIGWRLAFAASHDAAEQ